MRLLLFFLCVVSHQAQSALVFEGVVSFVTDGDTLWVQPDKGGPTRKLRLLGIDAPEICQLGGEASRNALIQLVLRKRVSVTVTRKDVYGRGLARVQVNNKDVGALMVRSGQAWSYRWQRSPSPYAREHALAQQSLLGLFADRQAMNPKDFRRRHGACHHATRSNLR
jgi:endonuclease YncB( thermonuclease family)